MVPSSLHDCAVKQATLARNLSAFRVHERACTRDRDSRRTPRLIPETLRKVGVQAEIRLSAFGPEKRVLLLRESRQVFDSAWLISNRIR